MGGRMDLESATTEELAAAASEFYRSVILHGSTDPEKTRGLAACAGMLLLRGADLPPPVLRWLGIALLAIGDGADAASAFRTKRPQGRPPAVDWVDIAIRYHALFRARIASTTACTSIAVDLAMETGREVDEKTVRNVVDEHIRWLYESEDAEFLRDLTPLEALHILELDRGYRELFRPFNGGKLGPHVNIEDED